MAAATQAESDEIVRRCRAAAEHYGGQSEQLTEVRKWYAIFHACPEHGAMVALDAELRKVESDLQEK